MYYSGFLIVRRFVIPFSSAIAVNIGLFLIIYGLDAVLIYSNSPSLRTIGNKGLSALAKCSYRTRLNIVGSIGTAFDVDNSAIAKTNSPFDSPKLISSSSPFR